jgi:hypothetical protein
VLAVGVLGLVLLMCRLQGRPVPWVRRTTLRPRRARDPVEQVLALGLRVLGRQVELEEVPRLAGAPRAEA